MKRTSSLIVALTLAGTVASQDPPPPPPPPPVQEVSAEARMEALNKELMEAVQKWQAEARKKAEEAAKAGGNSVPAMSMQPPLKPFVAKFQAAAKSYAGTDDAVPFLIQLVQLGAQFDQDAVGKAVETLAADHAASPKIADIVPMLPYLRHLAGEETAGKLEKAIAEKNKSPNVQGWLLLSKHGDTIENAPLDSPEYAAAKKTLLALVPDLTDPRLKGEITGGIDVREKFGKGQTAPDIVGVDLDGVEFKLSDYKGKVIFIDFWGDW